MLDWTLLALAATVPALAQAHEAPLEERVTHHFAEHDGVKLHYARLGEGPLLVMIHGFPDYWYTWRHQMEALAQDYTVVALDQRGYNKSDAPEGVDAYAMGLLVGDVVSVVRDAGFDKATLVGHDWGAAVAWQVSMHVPDLVEGLVVLSVPHPAGLMRELATNEEQKRDSQYAHDFQAPDSHESLTAEGLASWVSDEAARAKYVEAFERSSFDGMMNYYRKNYPRSTGSPSGGQGASAQPTPAPAWPSIKAPVLILHGREDRALNGHGHDGTWEHIEAESTLVMLPGVGHWVQHEASERVTRTIRDWLRR